MSVLDYKPYIISERRVGKNDIAPLNVYRISSYKDTEGNLRNLSGASSSLIMVIGLVPISTKDMKINALKISELDPEKFFGWLEKLGKPKDKLDFENYTSLSELLVPTDKTGKVLFERYVKPSPIVYNLNKSIYRTYNFEGMRYVSEVRFDVETLKKYLQ